ncbi:chromosome segregation protein SMC [Glaciecola sp. MH2013]|uniref:chromosome segregation protein SMC n=1 Tax=Glaciecola sp. MH2013 TaxID=2785524 RepID=UPI00189CFAC4|nr:chromosome segregation protein SMC [Glaciecola sp. MH2013]MBF7072651.1 chromosome segregation protein SMC [Glaciecola sp. MH2013]
MRLKKIKLAGFKSFVDPTTIPFPGEMTAVVGPNGCGKSNVIDAVRWVLGESSAKNLRGDAMTDVIFNGSTARKAVSQCSVELIFDNSSGRIAGEFAAYNELSVKRIVTKEAVSSYLLNGSKCRKRDITDLFLGTGLGPRSYAIIEQGMISKLIESRPQELRVFVEEAAGISKYKERRRETENRIRHTKENLERLDDVRAELGEQLNKLKRQAAAATRYKELKATERELKGQLAVYRWLKQSDLVKDAEATIVAKQTELEAVISRKRGDESNILLFREQQANFKTAISDCQKQIFNVSTNITKLEQSQLFSKKRKQQIQIELQLLDSQSQQIKEQFEETQTELELVQFDIVELEPNKLILEESVENAQVARDEAEQSLSTFNEKNRAGEAQYHALKQKLQTSHGQIQNIMSMQLRTQARIAELLKELEELKHNDIAQNEIMLQQELELVCESLESGKADYEHLSQQYDSAKADCERLGKIEATHYQELVAIKAQKQALEALQNHAKTTEEDFLASEKTRSFIDYLDVSKGYEHLVEVVIAHYYNAQVLEGRDASNISPAYFKEKNGQALFFEQAMTQQKKSNTLAAKLNNPKIPHFFNSIRLVESDEDAFVAINNDSLAEGESVISRDGLWLFADSLINGLSEQSDNSLTRRAEIEDLSLALLEKENAFDKAKKESTSCEQKKTDLLNLLEIAQRQIADYEGQEFRLNTQLHQVQQSIGEQAIRSERLQSELTKHQHAAQEEQETLELLNEEVEMLAMELAEYEDVMLNTQEHAEKLQNELQASRSQVEQLVAQMHETAMQFQHVKNRYSLLKEKQTAREVQLNDIEDKKSILMEEAEELSMPMEDQQDKLNNLLQEKEQLLLKQKDLQVQLGNVEEQLIEAEKGQSGIEQAAERIKSEIESVRLQAEGAKVRAQSYLDNLNDMQQSLKPILESLPEDIDEHAWQQNAERTSASISRLGAVNLAAVDEYEAQAERKAHLDAQNDDLSQALDTLETAIKKIDKETRTRFKATFDQINNDLKLLFPKVFGGGSAHLALTEDDMLDTGVTIMARPPGKKNSTIHLLSGGEKALTALSLVFAIFRLNPAPFCLLDEVDAPLDDANVGRFCKLVSEMSKTVQFIYITHNKVAMEMASHLTGVTMAEPGVSRMVAVDVEEALAIAE